MPRKSLNRNCSAIWAAVAIVVLHAHLQVGLAHEGRGNGVERPGMTCTAGSVLGMGQSTYTGSDCTPSSGCCSVSGSSDYVSRTNLAYSSATGMFSGYLVTNQCSQNTVGKFNGTALITQGFSAASCIKQTIPAFTSTPYAAPIRGAVGFSIGGGTNI